LQNPSARPEPCRQEDKEYQGTLRAPDCIQARIRQTVFQKEEGSPRAEAHHS